LVNAFVARFSVSKSTCFCAEVHTAPQIPHIAFSSFSRRQRAASVALFYFFCASPQGAPSVAQDAFDKKEPLFSL
jgi:hypothetical protein